MQSYRGQNFGGGYISNFRNDNIGRGRSRSRERQYLENFRRNEQSSRSRSRSRASTNRVWEYGHFAKDCRNVSDTEKEQSEQILQMLNLEDSIKSSCGRHLS